MATTVETRDIRQFRERLASGDVAGNPYLGLLGLPEMETPELLDRIEAGLPYRVWDRLIRNSTLPRDVLADLVQITSRTLSRRKEEGRFHPHESDRLVRAGRVIAGALSLFEGSAEEASRWLTSPQGALSGASPVEYARTEVGAREVERLIGRLEHGIPS